MHVMSCPMCEMFRRLESDRGGRGAARRLFFALAWDDEAVAKKKKIEVGTRTKGQRLSINGIPSLLW